MAEPYDVIIIGAGLTGLSLARNLTQDGGVAPNFLVLEARDRIGGRIHTHITEDGAPVEMGATWFFPFFRNLFKYMKGATFYESDPRSPPRKINQGDDGDMFRIKGGTGNLPATLCDNIDASRVLLSQVVTSINQVEEGGGGLLLEVVTRDKTFRAKKVVTTIPPQLLAHSVKFNPALPAEVAKVAKETHTWMGDSMKGAITYSRPFWREAGLAGALYSQTGPFVQMYDQTSTQEDRF